MNKNRLIRKRLMALTISACCLVGLCGQIPAASAAEPAYTVFSGATQSKNTSTNNYTIYDSVNNSYLVENEDSSWMRVEYIEDSGVLVECYAHDGTLQQSQVLPSELELFGGFYSGAQYNFVVYGQQNLAEDDATEVIRVVKYSKDWERLDSGSVYGENSQIPFYAGTMHMTESGDTLYIYTCHQMYADENGINHQSNMTILAQEETMDLTVSNTNYASHSFSQHIQTDGSYVYRVDHGDCYPRSVTLNRCSMDTTTESTTIDILEILGTYDVEKNYTGVSVGGLALSQENCLVVGNSVDQSDSETYDPEGTRNIFLTVTDKSLEQTDMIWVTNYNADDRVIVRTPQIVQYDTDAYLILWEEYLQKTRTTVVRMVTVDGNGMRTSQIITMSLQLSDCQPIVTSDGMVAWYVSDDEQVQLNCIDPTKLYQYDLYYNLYCGESLWWSFDEITGLLTITGSGTMYDYEDGMQPWADVLPQIKMVNLDTGVTSIGANAFAGADLNHIIISDAVTEIGDHAIGYLRDETTGNHTVDTDLTICSSGNNTVAQSYAAENGLSFAEIMGTCGDHVVWYVSDKTLYLVGYGEMDDRVMSVDGELVGGRLEIYLTLDPEYWVSDQVDYQDIITKVVVTEGMTELGGNAFDSFSQLTEVELPDSLTKIDGYAFQNCTALTEITLPPALTEISYNLFQGCTNLTTIMIPKSVTSIRQLAFNGCTSLTDVYYGGTEQDWNQIDFHFDAHEISDLSLLKATLHFADEDIKETDTTSTETETITTTTETTTTKTTNTEDSEETDITTTKSETISTMTETTTTETANTTDAVGARLCGDVTCDGDVNMADVIFLNKYAVNMVDLSDVAYLSADCNADRSVDGIDAQILLQFVIQIIDTLPYYA